MVGTVSGVLALDHVDDLKNCPSIIQFLRMQIIDLHVCPKSNISDSDTSATKIPLSGAGKNVPSLFLKSSLGSLFQYPVQMQINTINLNK